MAEALITPAIQQLISPSHKTHESLKVRSLFRVQGQAQFLLQQKPKVCLQTMCTHIVAQDKLVVSTRLYVCLTPCLSYTFILLLNFLWYCIGNVCLVSQHCGKRYFCGKRKTYLSLYLTSEVVLVIYPLSHICAFRQQPVPWVGDVRSSVLQRNGLQFQAGAELSDGRPFLDSHRTGETVLRNQS